MDATAPTPCVRVECDGHVATLTIDRPAALNALNSAVLDELAEALRAVASSAARCLVVTGAGDRVFVSGADVAQMRDMDRRAARAFSARGNEVFAALEQLPIPTIAAVNGYALGGGCELALACDIRVASTNAVFGQPEVGLGVTPGFGGTRRLARVVGLSVASELLFTGRRVKAAEALTIGLVNRVVAPEALTSTAAAIAAEIAANGPVAVRAAKAALAESLCADAELGADIESRQFASCFETADQREAMGAFVERRERAPFQGR